MVSPSRGCCGLPPTLGIDASCRSPASRAQDSSKHAGQLFVQLLLPRESVCALYHPRRRIHGEGHGEGLVHWQAGRFSTRIGTMNKIEKLRRSGIIVAIDAHGPASSVGAASHSVGSWTEGQPHLANRLLATRGSWKELVDLATHARSGSYVKPKSPCRQ